MDSPDTAVTWTCNSEGLPGAEARTIRDAVAVAEHALTLWHDLIRAATTNAISIIVTINRGRAEIDTKIDHDKSLVHIEVPADLLSDDPHVLGTRLLDAATDSLVTLSQHHPHIAPAAIWRPEQNTPPPETGSGLDIQLELLEPDELLILGRLDGTPTTGIARYHELDDYIGEAVQRGGLAIPDDASTACNSITWILKLNTDA